MLTMTTRAPFHDFDPNSINNKTATLDSIFLKVLGSAGYARIRLQSIVQKVHVHELGVHHKRCTLTRDVVHDIRGRLRLPSLVNLDAVAYEESEMESTAMMKVSS